jgi:hypothetical protein
VWLQVLLSTYYLVAIPLHCPCTTIGPTIPCDWRENIYVYIAMEYPQTPVPGRRQHLPDPPPRFLPPCLKSHCKSIAFSVASGFSVILLHFPSRCTLPPYFFLALYYLSLPLLVMVIVTKTLTIITRGNCTPFADLLALFCLLITRPLN